MLEPECETKSVNFFLIFLWLFTALITPDFGLEYKNCGIGSNAMTGVALYLMRTSNGIIWAHLRILLYQVEREYYFYWEIVGGKLLILKRVYLFVDTRLFTLT